jgi:hypothetical protein
LAGRERPEQPGATRCSLTEFTPFFALASPVSLSGDFFGTKPEKVDYFFRTYTEPTRKQDEIFIYLAKNLGFWLPVRDKQFRRPKKACGGIAVKWKGRQRQTQPVNQ